MQRSAEISPLGHWRPRVWQFHIGVLAEGGPGSLHLYLAGGHMVPADVLSG